MKLPRTSIDRGYEAETTALNFLQKKGLSLVERNFLCKLGEIDLIMRNNDSLVFVEVRMRNNKTFGSAEETVTRKKQIKIIKTATYYLQTHPNLAHKACRFDVVSVFNKTASYNPFETSNINWIQDAFQTTEWV